MFLLLNVMPNSSKPGRHSLRLDLYEMCFTEGGTILVLPAADPKEPPETCDLITLARPCLRCCSTPLGLVLRCPAARFVQKARLIFVQLVAERRDFDPRFFLFSRGSVVGQLFWWQRFFCAAFRGS